MSSYHQVATAMVLSAELVAGGRDSLVTNKNTYTYPCHV